MANTINNIKDASGVFARGIAQTLKDNLVFCGMVDKADATDFDGKNDFKSGDVIYTSIPPRYIPQEDSLDITSTIQDSVEEKAALTLNKTATIGMEMDSLELATDIDVKQALKRFGMPAAESIAHNIESRCLEIASDAVYNSVGTAGSNTFTVADVLAARTKLNQQLAPRGNRKLIMSSASGALAVDARKGLFQSSTEIDKQYKQGMVGRADGFDWYETELLNTHTNGNDDVFEVRTTVSTEGQATLVVEGLTTTTGTVKKGTVFTIDTVFEVHPITKETTSRLKQFVVTADATADASGYATLSVSPAFYTSGADGGLQNISAFPADGDAITIVGAASGAYEQNFAFHPSAFKMVTVPLYTPKGVDLVASETVDGITVNLVRDFDVLTRKVITRLDVLYGFDPVRPEWACKLTA